MKREIRALDYAIVQIVDFLDQILFNHAVVDKALREEGSDGVKMKLRNLEKKTKVYVSVEAQRLYLRGIDVFVVESGSAYVIATIRPVGWPKDSYITCKFSRGLFQKWIGTEAKLVMPGVFECIQLRYDLVNVGWLPTVDKCTGDAIENAAFMDLLRAFAKYVQEACK